MGYGIFRSDRLDCTKTGNIRSARYYESATPTTIENGMLVQVDELLDASANREIFEAVAPSAITSVNVGVVSTPELIYDETTKKNLGEFINAAGDNIRVSMLKKGDILSVSDECIDAESTVPVVGNYVIIKAGNTKWDEETSLGTTESLVGKIIARELFNSTRDTYLNVIEIIKA